MITDNSWSRVLLISVVFLMWGCSGGGGGDDDGVDGSGFNDYTGTAATGKAIGDADVEFKHHKGSKRKVKTDSNGHFLIRWEKDAFEPPFLMRVRHKDKWLYSIASASGNSNIHPFTDVVVRNWFKSGGRNRDVEEEFEHDNPIENPPTAEAINDIVTAIESLLRIAYRQFNVTNEQGGAFNFLRDTFTANGEKFDKLLDAIRITIENNTITIVITDPQTGLSGTIVVSFNLSDDFTQQDTTPPSEPTNITLLAASDNKVVVLWNASIDNVGVAGYDIFRDDASNAIGTSPYPVYIDSGVQPGATYCYSVRAFDAAQPPNVSTLPSAACITTPDIAETDPPAPPANFAVAAIGAHAVGLSWSASTSNDVLGYDVFMVVNEIDTKIATVVASAYDDLNLTASTEYCYKVQAFDSSLLRSVMTGPVCATTGNVNQADSVAPISNVDIPGGTYSSPQSVSLSCNEPCTVFYTLDGSTPTTSSISFDTTPLTIAQNTTLRFFGLDDAGNVEFPGHIEVYVIELPDTQAPVNTTADNFINGGAASTVSSTLQLQLSATDNKAVTDYCVVESSSDVSPGATPGCWKSILPTVVYSNTILYTLSGVYGAGSTVYVYTYFRDAVGKVSGVVSDGIIYDILVQDSQAPDNTTADNFINNGDEIVNAMTLSLALSAGDDVAVTHYCVQDYVEQPADPSAESCSWVAVSATTNYASTVSYVISHSVTMSDVIFIFVWFKDNAGNISAAHSDSIIYQPGDGPVSSTPLNFINWGAATTNSMSVVLSIAASDANDEIVAYYVAGATTTQIPNTPGFDAPEWISITPTTNFTAEVPFMFTGQVAADSQLFAYVWFKDAADNISSVTSDDILLTANVHYAGGFETGPGVWFGDGGVWQVGIPASGPGRCYAGNQCAATDLSGNYAAYTDSRLISPIIVLPTAVMGDEVHLRFMNWFYYEASDFGQVQVQVRDTVSGIWGAWENVGVAVSSHYSEWSRKVVDLTDYSGSTIRIAFMHVADRVNSGVANEAPGWYLDDIEIVTMTPTFTGDFESGWDRWGTDVGVWQVGTPTAGAGGACFTGDRCVGTHISGEYGAYTDSRLISATTKLPLVGGVGIEELHLRFMNWFHYDASDFGQVQIQVWDAVGGVWGDWENVGEIVSSHYSAWSLKDVDLTDYSGDTVRIAFLHVASRVNSGVKNETTGWYLDDIEIVTTLPTFTGDFESGWANWGTDVGVWQVGMPTAGAGGACFAGNRCVGTHIDGVYGAYTDSRLISATTLLPTASGLDEVRLSFQNWFSYSASDFGQVQIQVWDANGEVWGTWVDVGARVENTSGWSPKAVDLTPYAGQTVRIAFLHVATRVNSGVSNESTGWYIDDISILFIPGP